MVNLRLYERAALGGKGSLPEGVVVYKVFEEGVYSLRAISLSRISCVTTKSTIVMGPKTEQWAADDGAC